MDVVFRTDASLSMGTGHVMRCLTLANALAQEGATCRFIGREHPGHLLDHIRKSGHEARSLPLAEGCGTGGVTTAQEHETWLGATWETDAAQTAAAIGDDRPDWLVVDHYALDARWEGVLRDRCGGLAVLDDLADRRHDCDLLIDQNLGRHARDYATLVPPSCTVLAGASYALLRPEFGLLRPASLRRRRDGRLRQLLIALGGVDRDDYTSTILRGLGGCGMPADCHVAVALGAHAPWIANVRSIAQGLPWPVSIHVGAGNIAELMAESDLAMGAAGTMAWERCCLGLPTIVVVLAENQRSGARALASAGASIPLESPVSAVALQEAIAQALTPGTLGHMQDAAARITDGGGAQRVLSLMRRQHVRP